MDDVRLEAAVENVPDSDHGHAGLRISPEYIVNHAIFDCSETRRVSSFFCGRSHPALCAPKLNPDVWNDVVFW